MLTTLPQTSATALGDAPVLPAVGNAAVLFICYHFPPDASAGAIRPAKFAKYLSRLGWQPHILTVKEHHIPARDDTRVAEVAGLPIVRTPVWPTVLQAALRVRRRFTRATGSAPQSSRAAAPSGDSPARSLSATFKRHLNSLFELPDQQIGWLLPAAWRAYRLVRTERIHLVVTSSPPWTTGLIGLLLSYVAPVKIVTDLRDPWFTPYRRDAWFRLLNENAESWSRLGDAVQRRLERKLLQRSGGVITTNERHAAALRQAYPELGDGRISVIPNGYDAEDLEALPPAPAGRPFTIAYVGTFYLDRSPKQLFTAVSELVRDGRLPIAGIEIRLVGSMQSTRDGSVSDLVSSSGLTQCVRVEGPVSHRESLLRMAHADVLLLYQPQPYCSVPGKAFEYLAARRPILCLAQDGATADLVRQADAGVVVAPDDVPGIKAALVQLFASFTAGRTAHGTSDISIFERASQARQLSRALRRLL